MRKATVFVLLIGLVALGVAMTGAKSAKSAAWAFNATLIEACSCPMFCPCYFNTKPASHHGHGSDTGHFCRFNMGFKVNSGHHGKTKLDGAKFWIAGDLGGDFTKKMDWAVLTFDPAVTTEQREAITMMLGKLYPVEWNSFTVAEDAAVEWKASADRAEARLGGGKRAEVVLKRNPGMTNAPVVISNLVYWGAPRNDGFVLMPNEIEAYRAGDKPFEYRGSNGFMITVDMNANDF